MLALELEASRQRRQWKQEWHEGATRTRRLAASRPCPQPPCPEIPRHPLGRLASALVRRLSGGPRGGTRRDRGVPAASSAAGRFAAEGTCPAASWRPRLARRCPPRLFLSPA